MTDLREILARNMKAYRSALGLSQAKLAEKADTSTHYIGMIEVKKNFPSPEMLQRIAAAFGVDTLNLFSADINLPRSIKVSRKAALKDMKSLMVHFIDEKIRELDKET